MKKSEQINVGIFDRQIYPRLSDCTVLQGGNLRKGSFLIILRGHFKVIKHAKRLVDIRSVPMTDYILNINTACPCHFISKQ